MEAKAVVFCWLRFCYQ